MNMSGQRGNLSEMERLGSAVIGTALSLLLFRSGRPVLRSLAAMAGAGFLARAVAGHCAVKAAIVGQGRMLDAEEAVEERADPAAVEEGVSANEPAA